MRVCPLDYSLTGHIVQAPVCERMEIRVWFLEFNRLFIPISSCI